MSDIPVSDKKQAEQTSVNEVPVEDINTATVEPAAPTEGGEKKDSPEKEPAKAQAGPQQVDINLGNVDVLMLRLLGEIRDEIRMLRVAVTTPRPVAPEQTQTEQPSK